MIAACDRLGQISLAGCVVELHGPTGERNTYTLLPRDGVLCIAESEDDLLYQLATVIATDSRAVWIDTPSRRELASHLPHALSKRIDFAADMLSAPCSLAIIHAGRPQIADCSRRLAEREGPIVGMIAKAPGDRAIATSELARLCVERSLSVNTAAAGGNASLMTIG